MKRLTLVLSMLIALVGLNANAGIYLVGSEPFGQGWDPSKGVEMLDNGNGIYTYTATVDGTVYFCFAEGLDANWDVFNTEYRYGPAYGVDQTVTAGEWLTTQKQGNGNGSYKFTGTGDEYTVTFDLTNLQFKVEGYVAPITEDVYTVAGNLTVLFGTEWDPANADNDMTLVEGLYTWEKKNVELAAGTLSFKVTANHSWDIAYPSSNYDQPIDVDGIYDVKITFNADNKDVNCELILVQEVIPEIRGDVDRDGSVSISDVTALIDYLLSGQTAPATADCDKDGEVSISDVTTLIDFLLSGSWPVEEMVYTVAGVESVFGSNWDPTDENNDMVKGADGVYTWSKENVTLTGNFEFKVVGNHDWSAYEWPFGGGNNYVVNVAEEGIYTIVITFNPGAEEADRLTCTLTKTGDIAPVEHVYTVAGTANLFENDWDPSYEANNMTKGDDGIYRLSKAGYFQEGDQIEFKVVQDHNWANSWPAQNWFITIYETGAYNFEISFNPAANDDEKVSVNMTKEF